MNKIDPATIGVPNICFSLLEKTDERFAETANDRIERGFDDSETWSLTDTIANFILPRIKRYKEISDKVTVSTPKEDADLNSFIDMLELVARDSGSRNYTDDEKKRVKVGMKAFEKVFLGLWW
jgi:hypothetical protein